MHSSHGVFTVVSNFDPLGSRAYYWNARLDRRDWPSTLAMYVLDYRFVGRRGELARS